MFVVALYFFGAILGIPPTPLEVRFRNVLSSVASCRELSVSPKKFGDVTTVCLDKPSFSMLTRVSKKSSEKRLIEEYFN